MATKSLFARHNSLANTKTQLEILNNNELFGPKGLPTFNQQAEKFNSFPLRPIDLEILQINMGYMCNQVCAHCHVDAGPDRKEIMSKETLSQCLTILKNSKVHTIDLTGGAPEMNPHFRWFIEEVSQLGIRDIIVRSNLTILRANKKYLDLPEFFKKHNIHIISSMPHWTRGKTDQQRGEGVFEKSIQALKRLNEIGYGMPESNLQLDLVYNPSGAFLPTSQNALEIEFKKALLADFDIHFHKLFALTNLPISRFLEYLIASDNYEDYMQELVEAFNVTLNNIMCKNTLSIRWDGNIYDCDFNQMLDLKIASTCQNIAEFNIEQITKRNIITSQHCYGCTAGAGSSCQGSVI